MKGDRGTADRFRDLVQRRLLPGLEALGFTDRLPGSLAACEADGVVWMIDLPIAPWSNPSKVCFTVAWGVHVPRLDEIVGDPEPETPAVETCAVFGRAGEREDRLDPHWFELRAFPWPVAGFAETALVNQFVNAITNEILPKLRTLDSPGAVQRFLNRSLVTGRGAPSVEELRTIRRIAALSLLLGDRENAARWLDHLEARSAAAMAPDLVAERLAPLRELLAS
jgi:hypothetical protein